VARQRTLRRQIQRMLDRRPEHEQDRPPWRQQFKQLLDQFPSPFGVLLEDAGRELEAAAHRAIGDRWLRPPFGDEAHVPVVTWATNEGWTTCSPLLLYRKCPT